MPTLGRASESRSRACESRPLQAAWRGGSSDGCYLQNGSCAGARRALVTASAARHSVQPQARPHAGLASSTDGHVGLMQQMHADDVQVDALVVICTCMHARRMQKVTSTITFAPPSPISARRPVRAGRNHGVDDVGISGTAARQHAK